MDENDRAAYCNNQIEPLIRAPLRINHATLQNHPFALSIFDTLASIVATCDTEVSRSGSIDDEKVSRLGVAWIWHNVKMQKCTPKHSMIVEAYNCLIMLLIAIKHELNSRELYQRIGSTRRFKLNYGRQYHTCQSRKRTQTGLVASQRSCRLKGFKYYAIDKSLIMGNLEKPLMNGSPVFNLAP